MSEKYNIIEGRIQHKNDVEANWKKAVNFIPLEAEIVIYLPDEGHKTARIKVGDGITNVNDLPFSQEIDGALWQTGNSVTNNTGVAFGGSTQAGLLGYYFSRFKATQNTSTQIWSVEVDISTTQCKGLYKSENTSTLFTLTAGANDVVTPPSSTIPYSEGDVLTLLGGYRLENAITVTSVNANTVYGTWTSEESIFKAKITTGDINEDEYSIYCIAKPKAGEVPLGYYAHAEGWKTQALEKASHAEGRQTIAWGQFSHAEGTQTEAGYAAHSEGRNTKAQGDYAHAEGSNTRANGQFSHAEGYGTNAAGQAAHAEGSNTNAAGWSAHAEGGNTNAAGWSAHAEGDGTNAAGPYSHAEGNNTKAIGYASHAEGQDNISGSKAFTIKNLNKNTDGSGTYILDSVQGLEVEMVYSAHVYYSDKGWSTQGENYGKITGIDESTRTVTVDKLFCEYTFGTLNSYIDSDGYDNEFNTFRIITNPELGTRTIGAGTHAEGMSSEALSKGAHAEGYNTLAQGSYSHAEGQSTTAAFAAHAEGKITKASGFHSHAEGYGSTSSGKVSHAEGYNTLAQGSYSHAEGTYTTAAGNYSHAEGDHTTASGEAAHAEGFKSVAKGKYSHAEGSGTTAAGSHSHVGGSDSKASYSGSFVHGTGLNDNEENQTVIGKYNASAPGATFVVGNGTTSSNRSNAFVIYNDGSADIKNLKSMNVSSTKLLISSEQYDSTIHGFGIFAVPGHGVDDFIWTNNLVKYRNNTYVIQTWAMGQQVDSLFGKDIRKDATFTSHTLYELDDFGIEYLHAIVIDNEDGTTIDVGRVKGFSTNVAYNESQNLDGRADIRYSWSKLNVTFENAVPELNDFHYTEEWDAICNRYTLVFVEKSDAGNSISSHNSLIVGSDNRSSSSNSACIGTGLRTYGTDEEVVVGRYNSLKSGSLFTIGNGTDDENRSNAFEVDDDGNTYINNNLYIGGTGNNKNTAVEVATKTDIERLESSIITSEDFISVDNSTSYVDVPLNVMSNAFIDKIGGGTEDSSDPTAFFSTKCTKILSYGSNFLNLSLYQWNTEEISVLPTGEVSFTTSYMFGSEDIFGSKEYSSLTFTAEPADPTQLNIIPAGTYTSLDYIEVIASGSYDNSSKFAISTKFDCYSSDTGSFITTLNGTHTFSDDFRIKKITMSITYIGNYYSQYPELIIPLRISRGTTLKELRPYRNTTIFNIPYSIQNLDGYGNGIGNYYNYIDFENGKYVYRTAVLKLDPTIYKFNNTTGELDNKNSHLMDIQHKTNLWGDIAWKNPIISAPSVGGFTWDWTDPEAFVPRLAMVPWSDYGYSDFNTFNEELGGIPIMYVDIYGKEIDISDYIPKGGSIEVEPGGLIVFESEGGNGIVPNTITYQLVKGE